MTVVFVVDGGCRSRPLPMAGRRVEIGRDRAQGKRAREGKQHNTMI